MAQAHYTIDDEITALLDNYGKSCRVLHNVGEFPHMLDLRLKDGLLNLKFQIPAGYPDVLPEVIVRSSSIPRQTVEDLEHYVLELATKYQGSPMVAKIAHHALTWIDETGVTLVQQPDIPRQRQKHKEQGRRPRKQKAAEDCADPRSEKKPPMKTAEDVISRILWDESLPTECFVVGYMDRFQGVVEKNFTSLSWEDVASVDYNTLAIPKHRIQHFKYKEVKFWDKNERLDNMFGSTGSGLTIADVIKRYEAAEHLPAAVVAAGSDQIQATSQVHVDRTRPTHFLAVRINVEEIIEGIEAVQDAVVECQPSYNEFCTSRASQHLTLCTMVLKTVEQISDVCLTLGKAFNSEVAELAKDELMTLTLKGVGNFHNNVVFAKVHHDDEFLEFVNRLKVLLREAGVQGLDRQSFTPHVTIMKTSRAALREMKNKTINSFLYERFSEFYFGKQMVDGVHLCEISDQKRADGFYITPASFDLHRK